jgi:hypothetical protein
MFIIIDYQNYDYLFNTLVFQFLKDCKVASASASRSHIRKTSSAFFLECYISSIDDTSAEQARRDMYIVKMHQFVTLVYEAVHADSTQTPSENKYAWLLVCDELMLHFYMCYLTFFLLSAI